MYEIGYIIFLPPDVRKKTP